MPYRTADEIRAEIVELETRAAGQRFSPAQKSTWNSLNEELELQVRRDRVSELRNSPRHIEAGSPGIDDHYGPRVRVERDVLPGLEGDRGEALRTVERNAGELSARAQDRLAAVIEEDCATSSRGATARYLSAAGDDSYRSAFGKLLADPVMGHTHWTATEQEAMHRVNRVMEEQRSLGLGSQGGAYPVPIVLDPTVNLTSDGQLNPLRQIARVETITGFQWTGVASAGVTMAYGAEFTEASDNSPTLTQPTAYVEKAQGFVPYSIEAGEDWAALQSELARMLQEAKDTLEADKFLTGLGHGSNQPNGLHVNATAVVNTAATATFALADLYTLTEALPARWLAKASIVAHPAYLNRVRRFDTQGGAQLWSTLVGNGGPLAQPTPEYLLGFPTFKYTNMTSATTTGGTAITFGDFSNLRILDRIGMQIEVVPHLVGSANHRPIGARGLYCFFRNTSVLPAGYHPFISLKIL